MPEIDIQGTPYSYDDSRNSEFRALSRRVQDMRSAGQLSGDVLYRIRRFFRLKDIYHSNAIEGNALDIGETRTVVESGMTITGKPLKDQAEARNLSHALDFLDQLAKDSSRPIVENDIRQLHELVLKGIADDEAGRYRTTPVEISGSEYSPPRPESIRAQMTEFSDWMAGASAPTSNEFAGINGLLFAAAAHTWFVTIHPFVDGNGRVARLIMNLFLMRYGFPIAIISKEDRFRYYDALEASQASDLTPFSGLLAECVNESLEEWERAVAEQQEQTEWVQSLAEKLTEPERRETHNEYEVWRNAVGLLKSFFREVADKINKTTFVVNVYFKDYGELGFEKYFSLKYGESAKRTWFFRIDFVKRDRAKSARYLFFFGHESHAMKHRCNVTLHVAREEPSGSYNYERLESISGRNVPNILEIGYEMAKEQFIVRGRDRMAPEKVEKFGRKFINDIVAIHFGTS